MRKHTKGPWIPQTADGGCQVVSPGGVWICQLWTKYEEDMDNAEANARLIAASTDMLKVCDLLIESDYLAGGDVNEHERAKGVLMEAIAAAYEAVAKVEK